MLCRLARPRIMVRACLYRGVRQANGNMYIYDMNMHVLVANERYKGKHILLNYLVDCICNYLLVKIKKNEKPDDSIFLSCYCILWYTLEYICTIYPYIYLYIYVCIYIDACVVSWKLYIYWRPRIKDHQHIDKLHTCLNISTSISIKLQLSNSHDW